MTFHEEERERRELRMAAAARGRLVAERWSPPEKKSQPEPLCAACGAPMEAVRCKLLCSRPGCPYFESCSDLLPPLENSHD